MQNMDWLEEELGGYEDDYLIIDCPGIPPLLMARNLAEGSDNRANRVVHPSSIFTVACQAIGPAGAQGMRPLFARVAVHGGQI